MSRPLVAPQPAKKGFFNVVRTVRSSRLVDVSVPDTVLALHDPETMIRLNPRVLDYRQDAADPALWEITDMIQFACFTTATKYVAKFVLAERGIDSWARAAAGVYVQTQWRVENGPGGKANITETVIVHTPLLLAAYVVKQTEKSHAVLLAALANQLERGRSDKASD